MKENLFPGVLKGGIRVVFGVIWCVDAILKWLPSFMNNYAGYIINAAKGQPDWFSGWFGFWVNLVTNHTAFLAWSTRIAEAYIALALLLGFAGRLTYSFGLVYSLLLWSTAEGFGGPYTSGASDIGTAIIYALAFLTLLVMGETSPPSPYGLDDYLKRRIGWWRFFAEGGAQAGPEPERLSTMAQLGIAGGAALIILVIAGTLPSALGASTATAFNAAQAVSPLSVKKENILPSARDAILPPLLSRGKSTNITLTAEDKTVTIANGATYQAWTFNGTVPGPILHVRQGQNVNVTLKNDMQMQHSIDFHAAQVDWSTDYRSILPGESLHFSFKAEVPGAFLYHCGTPPVLEHIADGMYGAIIVDPAKPLPPADESYVLVQGEWYTEQAGSNVFAGDFDKMVSVEPDEVVFNGTAFQYKDHPLLAHAGKRVRFYVVDAGPNLPSAFHVIGGILKNVYPDGNRSHVLQNLQTYEIPPGGGAVVDVVIPHPGKNLFVDHSMRDTYEGAAGILQTIP